MTIVICGVACLGLISVMQQVLFSSHRPEVMAQAASLAEGEAERVIRLGFSNITDEHKNAPLNYNSTLSAYSWEVRVDSIDTAAATLGSDPSMSVYKMVEVRVHHPLINYFSLKFLKAKYSN